VRSHKVPPMWCCRANRAPWFGYTQRYSTVPYKVEFLSGSGILYGKRDWKFHSPYHSEWNQYLKTTEKYVKFWSIPLSSP
jgi:hypothetical protein